MDKGRRQELKMLKYKKRLKNYQLDESEGKFFCYRSHGKPCSCFMCSTHKYKHNGVKKQEEKEFKFQLSA